MIHFIEHHRIDREKWDHCIRNATLPLTYALTWYLDIVSPGWHALVEDDYRAVFPLTWNKKYGISYLYQPFFTQQLGLFSTDTGEPDHMNLFFSEIASHYKFADISLNESNLRKTDPLSVRFRTTLHLKLNESADNIEKKFSENHRRNLLKSRKMKVKVTEGGGVADLIHLFRENRGQTVYGIKESHFNMLEFLMNTAINQGQGRIISAYTEKGVYCAGVFFLKSFDRNIFLFSATNDTGRANGSMFAIIANYIREHSGSEEILDFEGSDRINLARFYSGFGATAKQYPRYCMNRLVIPFRWFKHCPR